MVVTSFEVSAKGLSFVKPLTERLVYGTLAVDSVTIADSVAVAKAPKDAIDAPVYYESTDSMVWSNGGNAYLYGSGKVVYDKIELMANVISMNMDSSVVHANGSVDSTGVVSGLPVFVDAGTPGVE